MKKTSLILFFTLCFFNIKAQNADTRLYEMRVYYAHDGKLEDLQNRFKKYTCKLFEQHGMENIGYWLPTDNKENKLTYILRYPDKIARDSSWKSFVSSSEWKKVVAKTEANGKLVSRVTVTFMQATDFSPIIEENKQKPNRIFQLRTYTAFPDKIENVLGRFRNHTTKLFENHGMQNIAYWTTIEDKKDVQPKLIYILGHESEAAGKASFDSFRKDGEWLKVRDESEKNGKIVEKIEAEFLTPLKFSKIK